MEDRALNATLGWFRLDPLIQELILFLLLSPLLKTENLKERWSIWMDSIHRYLP